MNKFIITEEEKSRILDMHKSRTSELYLNEDTSGTDWYAACTTFNSLPENKRNIVSFKNAASFVKDDKKRQQIFLSFGTPNGWCAKVNNYDKPDFNQLANKEISQGGDKYEDFDKFPTIVELLRRESTQQHMNEATQFTNEILLNKDTGGVSVLTMKGLVAKALEGATVEWYTGNNGAPGVKVNLPNGEMRSDETINVNVYEKATKKSIAKFTLKPSDVKQHNSTGTFFDSKTANVQGKQVIAQWKWKPNGILISNQEFTKKPKENKPSTLTKVASNVLNMLK